MALPDGKLLLEVLKGIEFVGSVEFLIVLAVAALDLAIVAWRVRTDELVLNAKLRKVFSKRVCFFVAEGFSRLVDSEPLSAWTYSMR